MDTFKTVPVVIAGLTFQSAYNPFKDRCYLTLSSVAEGLGIARKSITNWRDRVYEQQQQGEDTITVQTGLKNTPTLAYSVKTAIAYIEYRAIRIKDIKCQALLRAIVIADVERTIKEAHGLLITSEQHEQRRLELRKDFLGQVITHYNPSQGHLKDDVMNKAGLNDLEKDIAREFAYLKEKRNRRTINMMSNNWTIGDETHYMQAIDYAEDMLKRVANKYGVNEREITELRKQLLAI